MKKNVSSQVVGAQMITASDGSAFTGSVTCYVTGDGGTQAAGSVGSGACTHEGNGFHTYAPAQAETNYDHVAFTFTGTGAVPHTVQVYTGFPQTGDSYARLGAPAGASVSADVAAVKADTADTVADTNELQTDWANGGRLDLILDGRASQTSVDDLPTNAELATALDTADDAVLAAIASLQSHGDSTWTTAIGFSTLDAAGIRSALGMSTSNLPTEAADALLGRNVAGGSSSGRLVKEALYFLRNKWTIAGGTLTVYATDDSTSSWTSSLTQTAGDPVSESDPA